MLNFLKFSFITLIFLAFLMPQKELHACSVCGMGDPMAAAGDSRPAAGQIRVALENQSLTATAVSDDNTANKESLQQYTVKPVLIYSPAEFLNIVVGIPLTYKNWSLNDIASGSNVDSAQPFGLGDIDVGARFFLFQESNLNEKMRNSLALTAGVTTPTGNNNVMDASGARIDEHAQLGTGSWGPYIGLSYAYHKDPWNFSVYTAARFHTINAYDYFYGTGIVAGIAAQFRIWDPFALTLGIEGRYAFNDTLAGVTQIHTGGAVFGVTPGFILNIVSDLWLKGNVQIPFYTKLSGEQTVGATFNLNLEYAFHS
ncbi:MAG: hypothetical protein OEV66_10180 [Spirochaetia bacterium]|nr:hypothetical protein [Spirochaetia bacterium]